MEEYSITKANFDKQKNELKKFSNQPATSTELDSFSTSGKLSDFLSGGLLGLTSHKVTGDEMNELVAKLQTCFSEINERDRKVIKEFGQVYETFEALDKGYIQGIVIGVESAKKASQEAKDAQKDVDDTITALQATISKLKSFKDEIKSYKHLKDIDQVWGDLNRFDGELKKLSQSLKSHRDSLDKKIHELDNIKYLIEKQKHINDLDSMWDELQQTSEKTIAIVSRIDEYSESVDNRFNNIESFREELEALNHINDIDKLWESTATIQDRIESVSSAFTKRETDIEASIDSINELIGKQKHFNDIDILWDDLQNIKKNISEEHSQVTEKIDTLSAYADGLKTLIHLQDIDKEWVYSYELGTNVDRLMEANDVASNRLAETENKLQIVETENHNLKGKINKLFWLTGGALLFSGIQLLLLLAGVL